MPRRKLSLKVDKLVFCTFLGKEQVCYEKLIYLYFPVAREQKKADDNNKEAPQEEIEDKGADNKGADVINQGTTQQAMEAETAQVTE